MLGALRRLAAVGVAVALSMVFCFAVVGARANSYLSGNSVALGDSASEGDKHRTTIVLVTDTPDDVSSIHRHANDQDFRENLPKVTIIPHKPHEVHRGVLDRTDIVAARWHLFQSDSRVASLVKAALDQRKMVFLFGDHILTSNIDAEFGTNLAGETEKGPIPDEELQGVLLRYWRDQLLVGRAYIETPGSVTFAQILSWIFLELPQNVMPSHFGDQDGQITIASHSDWPILKAWFDIYQSWTDSQGLRMGDFNMDVYLHMGQNLSDGDIFIHRAKDPSPKRILIVRK